MDEAEMAAFDLLQSLFKTHLIPYSMKVIWDPIAQRRKWASFFGMIIVKIHEISKRGLYTKCLGDKVPRGARLHLHRKGTNPSRIRIPIPDLSLESNRLVNILLSFKWNAQGEEKVKEDSVLF